MFGSGTHVCGSIVWWACDGESCWGWIGGREWGVQSQVEGLAPDRNAGQPIAVSRGARGWAKGVLMWDWKAAFGGRVASVH